MSGACTDNPRLGITGCGATYSGEMQHCVAAVSWSEHTDGKAHITARLSTLERLWRKNTLANPAETSDLMLDGHGRWVKPMSVAERKVFDTYLAAGLS